MKCANHWHRVLLGVLAVLSFVGKDFLGNEDAFRNGELRYLTLLGVAIGTAALWRMNRAWALFWGWSTVLWILSDWQTYGMLDMLLIGLCLAAGNEVRKRFDAEHVLTGIAILAALEAVYGLMQVNGIDPFFDVEPAFKLKALGTVGHYTFFGPFVGLGAVAFLARGVKNYWNLLGLALCIAGVLASDSTMAAVGTGAGLLYVLWRRYPEWTVVCGILGAVVLASVWVAVPDAQFFSFTGRLTIWPYGVSAWLEHPIVGHGPGSWYGKYPSWNVGESVGTRWDQLHQDYLQCLVEQGAIGLLLVLGGLALAFRSFLRMPAEYGGMLALLCATSLGNFPMHVPCFGLLAGWLAALSQHHEPGGVPCKKKSR